MLRQFRDHFLDAHGVPRLDDFIPERVRKPACHAHHAQETQLQTFRGIVMTPGDRSHFRRQLPALCQDASSLGMVQPELFVLEVQ